MTSMNSVLLRSSARFASSLKSLGFTKCKDGVSLSSKHLDIVRGMMASSYVMSARPFSSEICKQILTKSTILTQDNGEIEELPILIRLATKETFPFTSHTYSGGNIRVETEFETDFKVTLQDCTSVSQVFKHLEVPHDKVQGYSAGFAIQRLHVLKHMNRDWTNIHSFIRSAVMKELYDTVQADISNLSNQTLISLVECYLSTVGFSPSCMDAINAELQRRLADAALSLEEVLTLANILHWVMKEFNKGEQSSAVDPPLSSTAMKIVSEAKSRFLSDTLNEKGPNSQHFDKFCAKSQETWELTKDRSTQLLDDVWVHLGSRYSDQTATTLPLTLQSLPKDRKSQISLLVTPMAKVYHELSSHGAQACLDSLVRLKVYSPKILGHLAKWSYLNIHLMTPQLLFSFLMTFMHFKHFDQNLVRVIERCVRKGGDETDCDILALCVEYCRYHRYLSPGMMETAASHFTQQASVYHDLPLFVVLRSFGFMNYMPTQPGFVKQVSRTLAQRFSSMNPHHVLEVLGSFTLLNKIPRSFEDKLADPTFYSSLGNLTMVENFHSNMWLRIIKHGFVVADPEAKLDWVLTKAKDPSHWKSSIYFYVHGQDFPRQNLKRILSNLLGDDFFHVIPFYGCNAFYLDHTGVPVSVRNEQKELDIDEHHTRYALVIRSAFHVTSNTRQLLGAQAKRKRDLEELGYKVIEIQSIDLQDTRYSKKTLKKVLSAHITSFRGHHSDSGNDKD